MITWHGEAEPPVPTPPDRAARWRMVWRSALVALAVMAGLVCLAALRLVEHLFLQGRRRWSPGVAMRVCRAALRATGLLLRMQGRPMTQPGAVVANHSSWLDILALNACQPVFFVSKAEVAEWPGIGWLARVAGTLFIRRDPKEARAQQAAMDARLRAGDRLVFFPEGTSSDGRRVLPFKSTLFQTFFAEGLAEVLWLQPVSLVYHAPEGADPRFYGWWGTMALGPHLAQVLGAARQGAVDVVFHPPLRVSDYASRKALALVSEDAVRAALPYFGADPLPGRAGVPAADAAPARAPASR